MFGKSRPSKADDDRYRGYPLEWPTSDRWNPHYEVPRNSLENPNSNTPARRETPTTPPECFDTGSRKQPAATARELPINAEDGVEGTEKRQHAELEAEEEGLADLSHWLETLGEIYMNNLDNRARWDPRWLNVTRRERYDGLRSASITILDYVAGDTGPRTALIAGKRHLAAALQSRPDNSEVRVVMVTDLSRFVMGALGQLFDMDPEFWFEHLANSGYAASDSQLKVANAVWMNWAERETRFRHRALPGVGQRTEWNSRRRAKGRTWAHLRWGRLGLMHYLGKKGFHEDEIERRLGDGRWIVERDITLDKNGLLMTERRLAKAKRASEKRNKKQPATTTAPEMPGRAKSTNVYRSYSTFEGLPKNVSAWRNRDLRVVAPEGGELLVGNGSSREENSCGVALLPRRLISTRHRPPFSKADLKRQKKEAIKQRLKSKKLRTDPDQEKDAFAASAPRESAFDDESVSAYTSDEEYDEDYEKELREDYADPKPHSRDRDYARKYSLPTDSLLRRQMSTLSTEAMSDDQSLVTSTLARLILDDFLQLLAEIRLQLDHLDNDISAELYGQLVESIGNSTRQNLSWMRATLQELRDWSDHLSSTVLIHAHPDITAELAELSLDVKALQARAEQTLNLLLSSMGLAQSSMVIDQTSGINKLTELAFFFVPISFITSVFSMQVSELTSTPPRIWTWGVALSTVVLSTYFIRSSLRSPSVRVAVLHCRATIINRFSSSQASSASRRLNTVGNRAIAKFLFFFICVVGILTTLVVVLSILFILLFGGLWLGTIATALYFIITRWPEPAVLVPCFLSLPLSGLGMYATWYWYDEITDWGEAVVEGSAYVMRRIFPDKWTLEKADDEDLAKEGVNTYARQALILAT
ncbi:hypothetical protein ACCO45_004637 [Purpureocillium lilacinum]|uniref:Uncharacterized protein n=1 Tax=Purpureocillium lilacinum TaxID=33203 RepID=A0ACC4DT43_PURLI